MQPRKTSGTAREEYMESFEPSYLRSDVIKSIEQASGVEYEKGHLLYEDDDWEL